MHRVAAVVLVVALVVLGAAALFAVLGDDDERRQGALGATASAPSAAWGLYSPATSALIAPVRSAEGCRAASDVVSEQAGPGSVPGKHPASLRYEPCTIQLGFGMSKELVGWISGAMSGNNARKNLWLVRMGTSQVRLELTQALLVGFELPELDMASKELGYFQLVLAPEAIRRMACCEKLPAPETLDPVLLSSFSLDFDNTPLTGVKEVDRWSFEREAQADSLGDQRDYELTPAPPEFADLAFRVEESDTKSIDSLAAYLDSFLIKRNSAASNEKTIVLRLLNGTKTRSAVVTFGPAGIVTGDWYPTDGGREYSFYVEKASFALKG